MFFYIETAEIFQNVMFHVNEESVLGIFHHIIPTKTADIHSVNRPVFQDLKQSLLLAPIQQNIDSSLKNDEREHF